MEAFQHQIFVSCAPGIEPLLADECKALNLKKANQPTIVDSPNAGEDNGGLLLEGSLLDVYRCNLHLRTASRVSVRLGAFNAVSFPELRKKAARLDWQSYIRPGQELYINVTCHKSRLYHSDAVAERILGAINDSFTRRNTATSLCKSSKNGQLVQVRLVNDVCTISIDSSGELLYKRGYRQETAKAPLRETLAAAMLLAAGWDAASPIIDPFCGSGTIPIEAALLASRIPPGITREFAFMRWPGFNQSTWQSLLTTARNDIKPVHVKIFGSDRDAGAIKIAAANAARAGQKASIEFKQQSISDLVAIEAPGWVITNPPYGIRVSSGKDLRDLYARFGEILRTSFAGWQVGIMSSDPRLTGNLGFKSAQSEWRFVNGGIPVKFHIFQP